jgi:tripartite ATP-independent transporter DctM subunit
MSIELVSIVLFGGILLLLALGVHVAFALGAVSVLVTLWLEGTNGLYVVATTTYGEITSATLITIPLFVIMSNFLLKSGISDRLFQGINYWLSGIKGNLALVSLFVCVMLAMTGGFGPGTLTMGTIAVPAMLNRGYDKSLALGSVMAGGVLGCVIPPSILMIIFGYIARVSVGKLFFSGVIPGLLCAGFYFLYIITRCRLQPQLAPGIPEMVTWKKRWGSLKEIILPILVIAAVLGSIFLGIATPTEAAAVGAMGSFLVCIIYRRLTQQVLVDSCVATIEISGMALWTLVAATLFGVVYTAAGAQEMVMEIVEGLTVNRWVIMIAMQVLLLIFGMFMDDFAVVTICAPIFVPISQTLGFDPIWFSIVFILNMQVAYLTPPFGWSLLLMKGIAPRSVTTQDIWRSIPPFVLMQLLTLVLVMIFPQIALWLPDRMF